MYKNLQAAGLFGSELDCGLVHRMRAGRLCECVGKGRKMGSQMSLRTIMPDVCQHAHAAPGSHGAVGSGQGGGGGATLRPNILARSCRQVAQVEAHQLGRSEPCHRLLLPLCDVQSHL